MAIIKKRHNRYKWTVIGKYIDTPTKAVVDVLFFQDSIGDFKMSMKPFPDRIVKGCRFGIKKSQINAKKKFAKQLQTFLDFSAGWGTIEAPIGIELPCLFGLLKIRKGKQRKLVLIQSADQYYKSKTVTLTAVAIDNLLYLDLLNRLKENKRKP